MPATFPETTPFVLSGAEADIYTVTTGKKAIKIEIWLCNTSTSGVVVTLYLIPSGGTSSAANTIYNDTIPAKRSIPMMINCNLSAGGKLRGFGSAASVVGVRVAAVEV